MAFQVRDTCYASAIEAVGAMASSQVGAVVAVSGNTYVVNAASYTANSITYVLQDVSSTGTLTKVASVNPSPCGLLDWQDGLTLGWSIAAAWIATAVVLHLRKAAHS